MTHNGAKTAPLRAPTLTYNQCFSCTFHHTQHTMVQRQSKIRENASPISYSSSSPHFPTSLSSRSFMSLLLTATKQLSKASWRSRNAASPQRDVRHRPSQTTQITCILHVYIKGLHWPVFFSLALLAHVQPGTALPSPDSLRWAQPSRPVFCLF